MSDAARKSIDQMRMCTYSSPQQCLPIISPDASGKIASKSLIFFVCYVLSPPHLARSSLCLPLPLLPLSLVVSRPSQADQLNNSSINYILRTHTHRPASITSFIAHTAPQCSCRHLLYSFHCRHEPALRPSFSLPLHRFFVSFSLRLHRFSSALACAFTGFRQQPLRSRNR